MANEPVKENSEPKPRALVRLGLSCNNACIFCHSRPTGCADDDLDTASARAKIEYAAQSGAAMAVFSGGEPTIRKDIFELFAFATELGLECGLITNARMLFYPDFAHRLADAGLCYALVSLHGDTAATHNRLVGQNAFAQTLRGLKNLAALPVEITVNTVLTKLNAHAPIGIAAIIANLCSVRYKISLPEPKGALLDNRNIVLSPREAAAAVRRIADSLAGGNLPFGFDGLTPCLLDNYFSLNDDFFTHGFCMASEPTEAQFFNPDRGDRSFYPACAKCSLRHVCPGIYTKYKEWFPDFAPEPVLRPVSNAIRFDLESRHKSEPRTDGCAAGISALPLPARRLAVESRNGISIYKTKEHETDAAELLLLKWELEQVYRPPARADADATQKPSSFEKLRLCEKCAGCRSRVCCAGLFVRAAGRRPHSIAAEAEAGLLELAHGRVLEIGCGDVPFLQRLKKLLREKRITHYLGIDPALSPETARAAKPPNLILEKTSLEEFCADEPFDTIFFFRSWHHIRDIDAAMAALLTATRPGSSVIVTEDIRHIVLFDEPEQPRNEMQLPAFEHFRNQSVDTAAEFLNSYGFTPRRIVPVKRETAAFWMLTAERTR